MRNKDVIEAFLQGENAKSGNMRSVVAPGDRQELYSYAAKIAERDTTEVWLCEPYRRSPTTSRHCNLIARALGYPSFAAGLERQNGN